MKKNPKWWLYEKSVLVTVHTLVNQYYGNYLKALEINNISDWKFEEKEMLLLKKETVNEVKNKRKVAKKTKQEQEMDELVKGLSGGLGGGGGDELLPSDIFVDKNWSGIPLTAKVIVVYLSPNFSAEKINYDSYLKQLQELKVLAKAKLAK